MLQKDQSIFLACADEEVTPLFTEKEFMLLKGIEKPQVRFNTFVDGKIDFGSILEPGSKVFVAIYAEMLIRATVHYIGEVEGYQGFLFGVELKVSINLSD